MENQQPENNQFSSYLFQNIPNYSMMYSTFTPVFGNTQFFIQPSSPGQVASGFPTIPYLSLEAMAYQAQLTANNVMPGNTQGTQNQTGLSTVTDASGKTVVASGYSPSAF